MKVDLTGKTAIVTGAGGVLAGKFALELAKAGAKVAVLDVNEAAVKATEMAIKEAGGTAVSVVCDVLDQNSMAEAEKKIYSELGDYHILVNAAGGNNVNASTSNEQFDEKDISDPNLISFFDLDTTMYNKVLNLNLMGTFIPTKVFVKRMLTVKNPAIINISSMSAFIALTKVSAYSAAKAAINNLTQWLAVHFGNTGLRVNAIAPGFIITHQNRQMMTNPDGTLTERSKKVIAHTPMKRMGEPDDLIGTLLFLCDEQASGYITGVVIPIDGGFMAAPGV